MSKRSLEERVAALEKEVTELRVLLGQGAPLKGWRATLGMFTGDEVMREIMEYALKVRAADRRRTR